MSTTSSFYYYCLFLTSLLNSWSSWEICKKFSRYCQLEDIGPNLFVCVASKKKMKTKMKILWSWWWCGLKRLMTIANVWKLDELFILVFQLTGGGLFLVLRLICLAAIRQRLLSLKFPFLKIKIENILKCYSWWLKNGLQWMLTIIKLLLKLW